MTLIRPIREADAACFLELCLSLDRETPFMMIEPDERTTTLEEQMGLICAVEADERRSILVAEQGDCLVGFIDVESGPFRRNRHSAWMALGVLAEARGQGVGRRLLAEAEAWADERGVRRLELTVMVHNERAVRLYRSMGYEIEGIRRDSLRVAGSYVNEFAMSKLLSSEATG